VQRGAHGARDRVEARVAGHRGDADGGGLRAAGLDAERRPDRLHAPVAEPVARPGAHEVASAGVCLERLVHEDAGQSAEHGSGDGGDLALDEVGRRRDLVGDGAGGHLERLAVRVGAPTQVVEDAEPVGAEREVDLAHAPGATGGVAEHDPHPHAMPRHEGVVDLLTDAVGVVGQQQPAAALAGVGAVDARRRHDRPGLGAHDARDAVTDGALGHDVLGLAAHHAVLVGVVRDEAERLARDLARDDDDVPVGQPHARVVEADLDDVGEVVALAHLGYAGERRDRDGRGHAGARSARSRRPRSRAAPAIWAAASTELMSSGRRWTSRPRRSGIGSSSSTSQPSRKSE
jgi:hypothetical protein